MTQTTNDTKTVKSQVIDDNYTAALSAFKSAAKLKGLYVKVITEPYREPVNVAEKMVRRVSAI